MPKIKKINSMNLDESKFHDVYNTIKEASDQRDLATILYYQEITKKIAGPKIKYDVFLSSASRGNIQLTKEFVECGANKFAVTSEGETLIHIFTRNQNLEAVKYFMKYDYDINKKDKNGNTPLHLAVLNADFNTCEYLCNLSDIKGYIRNKYNETPRDIAKRKGYNNIESILSKIPDRCFIA